MNQSQPLTDAVIAGNRNEATRLTSEALAEGNDPREVLAALVAGMDEVGGRFQRNEAFVPEMLIAARAMKESMAVLEPVLVKAGIRPERTAVIGTVLGDLHDIGKNLVAMMWRGAHFEVVDLGTNVPPERFVEAARTHDADLIGLSALLTTTMPSMKETIQAIRSAGLRAKVIIGGAPITPEFAQQIGADAFAADAASGVEIARAMLTHGDPP
ncbi:MAG: corrinoid protein [Fimbriimonadaceae bacterium]|nr:corrinoid protein [Chthonomonadaceae bacterium]MCO5296248.1 corrinoid protein [Fimbriimonadaceae bacterium]